MKKVGSNWLLNKYALKGIHLSSESYIGTVNKIELSSTSTVVKTYKPKYDVPYDNVFSHIEFALKHDDINLILLSAVFTQIKEKEIDQFVNGAPNRKYTRIIGFLYEFLTKHTLQSEITTSNYVDVLDASRYFTGDQIKISKWKVNNNLLGTKDYCPIIRKTSELKGALNWNITDAIEKLKHEFTPEIFNRASYYLFKKESKSSSEIEKEQPTQDRIDKFIVLLEEAGKKPIEESLSEDELVRIQNRIVDPRYADHKFRDFQNYVGQTTRDGSQKIHYICPPPQFVNSLMNGLIELHNKNTTVNSILKATSISFGFVYIHPFEDGNGRIHRFLIHDIFVRDSIVPNGTIMPVSAQILANMDKYDSILELVSNAIARKAKYTVNEKWEMTVQNADEIESFYRFPDLTSHAVFLAKSIQSTVTTDIPDELKFLKSYDELKSEIQSIVDMPNNKVDRLILFLHQHKGKLASRKRKFYGELSDIEIKRMEQAYSRVFN